MTAPLSNVVHTEVMDLNATPAQVRRFILTPERILDYYPEPVEGGVFEPGRSIWCRGQLGTSLLERLPSESSDDHVVLEVTTAIGLESPFTRERILAQRTFTMVEDWVLEATSQGTRLTKSWRDVQAAGPEPFPLAEAVRQGAIHESPLLVEAWNGAARGNDSGD
jgi:hypothetical protein